MLWSILDQQSLSNSFEESDSIDSFHNNNNDEQSRWNSGDLNFFDLIYNDKFVKNEKAIEHIEKETYFRNVYLFVERVYDIVAIKNIEVIRENL